MHAQHKGVRLTAPVQYTGHTVRIQGERTCQLPHALDILARLACAENKTGAGGHAFTIIALGVADFRTKL